MRILASKASRSRKSNLNLTPMAVALLLAAVQTNFGLPGALAVETAPAAETFASSEFALDPGAKDHEEDRKEIEKVLSAIETNWNEHNLDNVMSYYADDYINNDGLDKKAVQLSRKIFGRPIPTPNPIRR